MKPSSLSVALGSIAMLTLAGTAMANEPAEQIVRYHPLELATDAGRAELDENVRKAARNVCYAPGPRTAAESREARTCYETAIEQAAIDLDAHQRLVRAQASRMEQRRSDNS